MGGCGCHCWCSWGLWYCKPLGSFQRQNHRGCHGRDCGNHTNSRIFKALVFKVWTVVTTIILEPFDHSAFTIYKYSFIGSKCWVNLNKFGHQNVIFNINVITWKKYIFVTDTNVHKPLIWTPRLCVPKIDKTMSKSLSNSPWIATYGCLTFIFYQKYFLWQNGLTASLFSCHDTYLKPGTF